MEFALIGANTSESQKILSKLKLLNLVKVISRIRVGLPNKT